MGGGRAALGQKKGGGGVHCAVTRLNRSVPWERRRLFYLQTASKWLSYLRRPTTSLGRGRERGREREGRKRNGKASRDGARKLQKKTERKRKKESRDREQRKREETESRERERNEKSKREEGEQPGRGERLF